MEQNMIQHYLERISYIGNREPSQENLSRLIRNHLETVPFESLDCYYERKDVSLEIGELYRKIVEKRRGGICFELNGLFYALLKGLGYNCYPVGARVQFGTSELRPITHEGIIVTLEGKRYYCDVGFGGPGPKGLLSLDEKAPQLIAGEPFLLEQEGLEYRILRRKNEGWERVLVFSDVPFAPCDFVALCFYQATHPESHFVRHRIVNLCLADGSLSLMDDTLTERRGTRTVRTVYSAEEEVDELLRTRFGLIR